MANRETGNTCRRSSSMTILRMRAKWSAFVDLAQLRGHHAQELHVVRQEVTRGGQEQGEETRQEENEAGEQEQGAAVFDEGLQEAALSALTRVMNESAASSRGRSASANELDGTNDHPEDVLPNLVTTTIWLSSVAHLSTMCIGDDLGQVETQATPLPDGLRGPLASKASFPYPRHLRFRYNVTPRFHIYPTSISNASQVLQPHDNLGVGECVFYGIIDQDKRNRLKRIKKARSIM